MKNMLPGLLIFLFFSCHQKSVKPFPRLVLPKSDTIIRVNTNQMIQSGAPSLQVNFDGDTTVEFRRFSDEINFVNSRMTLNGITEGPQPDGIQIFIDTSYAFYAKGFVFEYEPFPYQLGKNAVENDKKIDAYFDKRHRLQRTAVAAYPVLFYNPTNKKIPIYIGTFDEFKFIQEAIDTDGKWKPIEFWETLPMCVGGDDYFEILPKHYAASAVVKYHGNFKTRLRVRMMISGKSFYSNSIIGHINRSQFNQDFVKFEAQHWHLHSLRPEEVTPEDIRRKKHLLFLDPEKFEWDQPTTD
jgi:hypothetical protein